MILLTTGFHRERELLPYSLLEQVKKTYDYEIAKEILAEYELLVDRYEQPIERPKDYQEQKKTS